jgi:hypothetical protein
LSWRTRKWVSGSAAAFAGLALILALYACSGVRPSRALCGLVVL